MQRKEYERVSPESVGIPSAVILDMIEALEEVTEMHGIMVLRHGKVCAEGWWSPYAPGLRHGQLSQTKAYVGTAIGLAYTEGALQLGEHLVDIFPDKLPEVVSDGLSNLTIRDLLMMSTGMTTCSTEGTDWLETFLATPVNHAPGTKFYYNYAGSCVLGEIIKRKTGTTVFEYLKRKLFDKIGINGRNVAWDRLPNGSEDASGGLLATTEDTLRLMNLYLNGGVWEGERLLATDYVQMATTSQIETKDAMPNGPLAIDHLMGYGFQLWMCQPEGAYRSDGAGGQYGIVFPREDLIVSITETGAPDDDGVQRPLDVIYRTLGKALSDQALPEDLSAYTRMKRRLRGLALARPKFRPYSPLIEELEGVVWKVSNGCVFVEMYRSLLGKTLTNGIQQFTFRFGIGRIWMDYLADGMKRTLEIGTDGTRVRNIISNPMTPYSEALLSGFWVSDNMLRITIRWIEGPYEHILDFEFDDPTVVIRPSDLTELPFPIDREVHAVRL